uniref:Uncharacterized protein n=1 Tax=Ananas comosus var. bracteatus TaxID=296719 RepID=A0A6V7PFS0_ANACO|nr:unnamed protein product [Ananas comosus var. bracteatus]
MSSVLEGGRSPSGDALRSYASRVGVNPKDGPSGPSGKVGDVEAEPTGNFVVVLTPLFPQSRDRASRRATEVKGRSPQAGTPEIAYATQARPCGIGRQNGMPWGRLIPRVGMLTTTGPFLAQHKSDYTRVDP